MTVDMPRPIGHIKASNFYLETNTQAFTSPVNKSTQTIELSGARWRADYTLRKMKLLDKRIWSAFLLKLRGMAEAFYAYDPDYIRLGRGGGTPLVKGAGQTGSTLLVDGCSANITGWLLSGDRFELNGQLHELTADVNTNGSGEVTLAFQPFMRNSPADNAALTIDNPRCRMKLMDDNQLSWPSDQNKTYQEKSFSGVEAIP